MNSAICSFEKTAKIYPDKIAIKDKNGEISFSQLREKSLQIGTFFLDINLPVIICLEKSIASIEIMFGALYSGNFYVPVDYTIPIYKLNTIIDSFGEAILISDSKGFARLDGANAKLYNYDEFFDDRGNFKYNDTEINVNEDKISERVNKVIDLDPACILHTSGSTGVPKGVVITHREIRQYVEWLRDTFDIDSDTVFGNQAPFYFDNSICDIFGMALNGSTMVIIPEVLAAFTKKLMDFVKDEKITFILWVPTVLISIANDGSLENIDMPDLKTVLFAGEVMPNKQLNIWRKNLPNCLYGNLYGPTESNVCTYYIVDREFDDAEVLPIGVPCKNIKILILTDDMKLAKTGETGTIYIGGSCLAKGYWNREEKTSEVFIQNPINSYFEETLYNTGDLAYYDTDGNIIFVGRRDSQIQFRGNRVELGEIENAAKSLANIENAVAIYDEDRDDIVLVIMTKEELKLRKVNLELKKIISNYMLPTRLICMAELPKTGNKKIDRVYLKEYIKEQ